MSTEENSNRYWKEAVQNWRSHVVTIAILDDLTQLKEGIKEEWANGLLRGDRDNEMVVLGQVQLINTLFDKIAELENGPEETEYNGNIENSN